MSTTVRPGVRPAVVAVGASAGGVTALRALVGALPAATPAAIVVVLHIPPHAPSALAAILDRAGPLPASTAVHGTPLRAGHVHVAPADRHLLVARRRLLLSDEPPQHGHRPAIDPLLLSAGRVYGPRAVGVVLSGTGSDGAAGIAEIAAAGGAVFVQDPGEAEHAAMPRNALRHVPEVVALPVEELAAEISRLLGPDRMRPRRATGGH